MPFRPEVGNGSASEDDTALGLRGSLPCSLELASGAANALKVSRLSPSKGTSEQVAFSKSAFPQGLKPR